jgi:hypothetical protein
MSIIGLVAVVIKLNGIIIIIIIIIMKERHNKAAIAEIIITVKY